MSEYSVSDNSLKKALEDRGYATRNLLTKADFQIALDRVNKFYGTILNVEDIGWEQTMEQALSDKSLKIKIMNTIEEYIAIHTIGLNNTK